MIVNMILIVCVGLTWWKASPLSSCSGQPLNCSHLRVHAETNQFRPIIFTSQGPSFCCSDQRHSRSVSTLLRYLIAPNRCLKTHLDSCGPAVAACPGSCEDKAGQSFASPPPRRPPCRTGCKGACHLWIRCNLIVDCACALKPLPDAGRQSQ